ncbi:hypothetical protein [Pseudomonas fildesensis]|nr:hypothetical protein [Pseudomonas fildesensis]
MGVSCLIEDNAHHPLSPAQDLLKGGGKTVDPNFSRGKFGVVRFPQAVI